jgi:ATP-dependent protease ClpP protease subunit
VTSTSRAERRATIQIRAQALADLSAAPGVRAAQAATDTSAGGAGASAELWLYGVVGGFWWGFSSDTVAHALRSLDDDVEKIVVRLDSPGGSATQGLAIANLLANHAASVTVVVDGLAASAASQVALAGDEVVMSPGAQMMLHDAWMITIGNAAELHSDADWLDKQSRNYAETYAHRAGGTAEQWREVMLAAAGRGTWYTAQEAVDAGLADRVGNIASTTPPPPEPTPDEDDDEASARARLDLELVAPGVRSAWTDRLAAITRHHNPPAASAGGSPPTHEGSLTVAFSDEQITTMRQQLGVPEDADEATILAAFSEALEERAEPTPSNTAVPEGHVVVPEARLKDLEAGAAAGTAAAKKLHDREREDFLNANRTKYAPTNRAAWAKEYDRDPAGTRKHFEDAAEIVPTDSIGHDGDPVGTTHAEEDQAYYALYPDEKKAV